jgi:hypothetical protein
MCDKGKKADIRANKGKLLDKRIGVREKVDSRDLNKLGSTVAVPHFQTIDSGRSPALMWGQA